jgi:hypothetical protein
MVTHMCYLVRLTLVYLSFVVSTERKEILRWLNEGPEKTIRGR